MRKLNILSLGAGVQSSTLALMAEHGEIGPMPDAAGFGDTQSEPLAVYQWLGWLEKQLSFPVHRVTKGSLLADSLIIRRSKKSGKLYMNNLIPAFVLKPDGKRGLLGRKCTADYKVGQMVALSRRLVGAEAMKAWRKRHKKSLKELSDWEKDCLLARRNKTAAPMRPSQAWLECQSDPLSVSWIGISSDESHRMKESRDAWIVTRWPLVEAGISRRDCLAWMEKKGYPTPPRSACTFCPFHSDDEWIRIKTETPDEWLAVVDFERKVQDCASRQEALTGIPFLHPSCQPIDQVVFKPSNPGMQQVDLFGNECEGLCGV